MRETGRTTSRADPVPARSPPRSFRDDKTPPVPPFHVDAVRVVGPVAFTGLFPAGHRWSRFQFFSRLPPVTPVRHRVGVPPVFHDHRLPDEDIRAVKAAGESGRPAAMFRNDAGHPELIPGPARLRCSSAIRRRYLPVIPCFAVSPGIFQASPAAA